MDPIELYQTNIRKYEDFASDLNGLLKKILKQKKIQFHFIESRAKEVDSFRDKIARKQGKYVNPLEDIKDLVGLRVILYYNDDAKKVVEILKSEFDIDLENSNISGDVQQPHEFGYTSTHLVCKLNTHRRELLEWDMYSDINFEIQVRTVLQHAWASISHALQYKTEHSIPNALKRQLFRLSGLFELADSEFLSIRNAHEIIKNETALLDFSEIEKQDVDIVTIFNYVESAKVVDRLLKAAIKNGFTEVDPDEHIRVNENFTETQYADLVSYCYVYDIMTIGELNAILEDCESDASQFFAELMAEHRKNSKYGGWLIDRPTVAMWMLISNYISITPIDHLINMGFAKWAAEAITKVSQSIKNERRTD